jgi:hypothetical protein
MLFHSQTILLNTFRLLFKLIEAVCESASINAFNAIGGLLVIFARFIPNN